MFLLLLRGLWKRYRKLYRYTAGLHYKHKICCALIVVVAFKLCMGLCDPVNNINKLSQGNILLEKTSY